MKMQTKIKKEMNKRNTEITKEILSSQAKLVDLTPFRTDDYIKCKGIYAEVIENRLRIAFVRCPKCREHISVYKDELEDQEGHTKLKKCRCGFQKTLLLKKWAKR